MAKAKILVLPLMHAPCVRTKVISKKAVMLFVWHVVRLFLSLPSVEVAAVIQFLLSMR